MQKKHLKFMHWMLIAFFPFLAGCQTGLSSLFGLVGFDNIFAFSGSSDLALLASGGGGGGSLLSTSGDAIAVVHNPEPASMLLLGGGMAAMAYLNKKRKQK